MKLTKYKLRQLISLCSGGNEDLRFGEESLKGISINKNFMSSKANIEGESLKNYTVVEPRCFSFVTVTSRNGNKISIAFNDTERSFLVSSFYVTFKLNDFGKSVLMEEYLYLFFNRNEFDRYARRDSWGSAREYFYFENMCNVEIKLPPLSVQQKYVAIYKAMIANQQNYERGLYDLKLSIDALLDEFKHSSSKLPVKDILEEIDVRNSENSITEVSGVNITKQFMPSVASSDDLHNYKIVSNKQFVYSGMQTGRDKCIRIALLNDDKPRIVSPAYNVLQGKNDKVLPEYIQMWFSRSEMDRIGWFMSDSSIRSNLDLPRFYEIEVPIPSKKEQEAIVNIYSAYTTRRDINERLKAQIRNICPILIKGSLEECTE